MNYKKNLWNAWTVMVFMMMAMCAVSCSNDDDDKKDETSEPSIVGVWKTTSGYQSGAYYQLTLKADGTGYEEERTGYGNEGFYGHISYSYDKKTQVLTLISLDENNRISVFNVLSLTEDRLVMRYYDDEDDEVEVYIRQ